MNTNRNCVTVFLGLALCLSMTAAAQTTIDFSSLPQTHVYLPIPNGYGGMNWEFNYITQGTRNVAVPKSFLGLAHTMTSADPNLSFQVLGLSVVGAPNTKLTLIGYNHGVFKGSQQYQLSLTLTQLRVPPEWGQITQLTFVCMSPFYKLLAVTLQ